tara:strand:+ start:70 stop:591 length:522 start_codon:yes stop_codon:yes gene_type:complete
MNGPLNGGLQSFALLFKWTTSRGRDTYGYNICSLWVRESKEASTCGGGYDMKGTALGYFLEERFQDRLLKLHRRAGSRYSVAPEGSPAAKAGKAYKRLTTPNKKRPWSDHGEFYGLTAYYRRGESKPYKMSMDGGCGFSCMVDIGRAVGLSFRYQYANTNETLYTMTDKRAEA